MGLSSGTKLGPYEIGASLGAGGMGEVYRARDTRLDRSVAIKILPPHLADKADASERFGVDTDDHAAVGVARVAPRRAHPVHDHRAGLGHGGHDEAARTHAEGEHRARAATVHELVRGARQVRVPGESAILYAIDQGLRVLDPEAQRKGLRFDRVALLEQHGIDVARRVA